MIFQRNFFQVWFQGCQNLQNEDFKENIEKWKFLNPTWKYNCIDDKFLQKSCLEFSKECFEIYKQLPTIMKIDLGRYIVLYLYGGAYADMDIYPMKKLNNSRYVKNLINEYENNNNHVMGLSLFNTTLLESFVLVQDSIFINNAIMFSSPKNPSLKRFIENTLITLKDSIQRKIDLNAFINITNLSGPNSVNYFFKNKKNVHDTKLIYFPNTVFESCDSNKNCNITSDTIGIHLYSHSWVSEPMATFFNIYSKAKPLLQFIPLVLILVVFYFIYKRK